MEWSEASGIREGRPRLQWRGPRRFFTGLPVSPSSEGTWTSWSWKERRVFSAVAQALSSGVWARALLGLAFGSVGCAGPVLEAPAAPDENPSAVWEARLGEVVSARGVVDRVALQADHAALDAFMGWVAEHGPETERFRSTDDNLRLAWHLNALNAAALWAFVQGIPVAPGSGLGLSFRVRVDWEVRRMDRYLSNDILPIYEEPRVIAAVPCHLGAPVSACPPMANRLYTKPGLNRALDRQMTGWAQSGGLVWESGEHLVFSPLLASVERDFARWSGLPTLCAVAAPYVSATLATRLQADAGCAHVVGGWGGRASSNAAR